VRRCAALFALLTTFPATAMDIQGHRGARGHLPENTLPAFEYAAKLGVDTLELDVGVTRDGVVVVHHDRRLNPDVARAADGRWVRAPAPTIFSLTFVEIQKFDVGRLRPGSEYAARFPHQKPLDGTRIPRLSEVLKLDRRFNIETKIDPKAPDETLPPEAFARALVAEIRKAGAESRTTIQSFDFRTLKVVEREAPEIATVYLTMGAASDPAAVKAAGARNWSPDFRDLDAAKIRAAREAGLKIIPWTVNEPADIERLIALGVDGIISDYPDRVLERRRTRK
jgi:glycerophosphoryl diester phosphodiesterase